MLCSATFFSLPIWVKVYKLSRCNPKSNPNLDVLDFFLDAARL